MLRRRVGVRAAEDVRVAEGSRAVLLRRRRRRGSCPSSATCARRRSAGSPRALRGVVPDRRTVGPSSQPRRRSRRGTRRSAFCARTARVTRRAAMQLAERAGRRRPADVGMQHDPDERARVARVRPVRRREGVVDDVDVRAVRRDRRCRVQAAVAARSRSAAAPTTSSPPSVDSVKYTCGASMSPLT